MFLNFNKKRNKNRPKPVFIILVKWIFLVDAIVLINDTSCVMFSRPAAVNGRAPG